MTLNTVVILENLVAGPFKSYDKVIYHTSIFVPISTFDNPQLYHAAASMMERAAKTKEPLPYLRALTMEEEAASLRTSPHQSNIDESGRDHLNGYAIVHVSSENRFQTQRIAQACLDGFRMAGTHQIKYVKNIS